MRKVTRKCNKIIIVGGGTAGWITAARIAKRHGAATQNPVSVTLVESSTIKTIGVGEGTWPTLRETLEAVGASETDFIRECGATFKQGGKFVSWTHNDPEEGYYHPFNLPSGHQELNMAAYWTGLKRDTDLNFAEAVDYQSRLCDTGLAPKKITTPEYQAIANYAYHLDTHKLGEFLKKHCVTNLGVHHQYADVEEVTTDEKGYIQSLTFKDKNTLSGDLFVDCTGSRSLLLGQTLGVSFKSCQDILFVDRALAAQAPYAKPDDPIACHTIATAQSAGWIWDIGVQERRGIGHVYSSSHTTDEAAERVLREYLSSQTSSNPDDLSIRKIEIRNGYREAFWVKNCVAVGLSAGFLEPLEASAIMLLESAAKLIADRLPPNQEAMSIVAKSFNKIMTERWERIVDFLKLHYAITKRTDSDFWIDNTRSETIPDQLQEMLQLWRHVPPSDLDFEGASSVFPAASYQYVLLGMAYECDYSHGIGDERARTKARKFLTMPDTAFVRLSEELPSHRHLVNAICQHGLQAV